MTVSTSPRFGLTRWSADGDPQNRGHFDNDNGALEANAAMFKVVAAADHSDRGAAGKVGRIARCSVHGEVWWDDGAAWQPVVDLNAPRGIKAWLQHGSSNDYSFEGLVADGASVSAAVTFTAEANRLYRVEWGEGIVDGQSAYVNSPSVQDQAHLRLRYKAGTSAPGTGDTVCGAARQTVFSADSTYDTSKTVVGWINNPAPGDYTVGGFLANQGHLVTGGVRLLTVGVSIVLSVSDVGKAQ